MNQKAAHIERKQQTAEYDRFKKALTKVVMQKGIESSALGCSKSAAGMIILGKPNQIKNKIRKKIILSYRASLKSRKKNKAGRNCS